ncbi:NAD(P)H-dependent flavin oxidoreductase [Bacillus testis]|uniref:NAD(P)H-dependent flavin oxidoreductase n=1 Tax=Bacillus testis TaxID=1622072 RepID=UPI00067F443E|nr:nitronate monooxygenase [Bacillus testis]
MAFQGSTIIQAPMAGGAANPLLAATVCNAGGIGFLAGGYKKAEEIKKEIREIRKMTKAPFGVNLFVPSSDPASLAGLEAYKLKLERAAKALGCSLGEVRMDDDDWEEKKKIVAEEKIPFVSFTFGCPDRTDIQWLQKKGTSVIVTVTNEVEAEQALKNQANALCVQGPEAGGHRSVFQNNGSPKEDEASLLEILSSVRRITSAPLIAAGGIMDGTGIREMLDAGADAVQMGTAFLCCPESGAHPIYKEALRNPAFTETIVTRSFTGRPARGLKNDFIAAYDDCAPALYPYVHQLTQPIRKAAADRGDAGYMSLWAGTGFKGIRPLPAEELVKKLLDEAGLER